MCVSRSVCVYIDSVCVCLFLCVTKRVREVSVCVCGGLECSER